MEGLYVSSRLFPEDFPSIPSLALGEQNTQKPWGSVSRLWARTLPSLTLESVSSETHLSFLFPRICRSKITLNSFLVDIHLGSKAKDLEQGHCWGYLRSPHPHLLALPPEPPRPTLAALPKASAASAPSTRDPASASFLFPWPAPVPGLARSGLLQKAFLIGFPVSRLRKLANRTLVSDLSDSSLLGISRPHECEQRPPPSGCVSPTKFWNLRFPNC